MEFLILLNKKSIPYYICIQTDFQNHFQINPQKQTIKTEIKMENNITRHKSVQSIFDRIRFRTDRYPHTVIFDYSPECKYQLQIDIIKLEEGEHPIFESNNPRFGYVLLTTHYLYSIILYDSETPLLVKNQSFKVRIQDIVYYKYVSEIIEEKEKRKDYTESVLKFIPTTTDKGAVLLYINVGVDEYIFHETLRQLVAMNNFYKTK